MARSRDVMNNPASRSEARASCGGVRLSEKRDVMNYKPPVGPMGIEDPRGVGIHGPTPEKCGTQGPSAGPQGSSSGAVGITRLGGERVGSANAGTQGKY